MTENQQQTPPAPEAAAVTYRRTGPRAKTEMRARWTAVDSTKEVGALIRVLRLRMGFSQVEAAELLHVGRRWYNDMENGKETIRMGMVFEVLNAFGCRMAIGGDGAGFTVDELQKVAAVKGKETQLWEVEFERGDRVKSEPLERRGRGHPKGFLSAKEQIAKNEVREMRPRKPSSAWQRKKKEG